MKLLEDLGQSSNIIKLHQYRSKNDKLLVDKRWIMEQIGRYCKNSSEREYCDLRVPEVEMVRRFLSLGIFLNMRWRELAVVYKRKDTVKSDSQNQRLNN